MITKISRALALSLTLSLAVAPAARLAHACGGYGDYDPNVTSARLRALQAADALQSRNASAALASFTADASASHEYRGCCQAPTWSAADWIRLRFADPTWRVGSLSRLVRTPDGTAFVATFTGGTIASIPSTHTFTIALEGQQWKISRVYTAREARAA
ncbi:MAG: hypothetical protein U0269_12900 [Polyangiales bacterium]